MGIERFDFVAKAQFLFSDSNKVGSKNNIKRPTNLDFSGEQ